ncbi:uncharacterized protein LOC132727909 [Ruditapes philippinarum]|uniref:uncharacterized protein LOC132727909 n=1 Tax=Ruditapes philippinarum TaxID=129788 RepID=UPI00295B09E8|nr:uncharacterized protein LOC132727909 [Ruditapes philippinarum]
MDMETILIPKVSTLTKDMEMFSNIEKFSAVTGYVPNMEHVSKKIKTVRGNRLTNVLRTLRNSVLKKSRADYNLLTNDEFRYTLFSSETKVKLRERKQTLVELIKRHEKALLALRDARMKCWKSKDKLDECKLSLETQKSALRYNEDEKKPRTAAIKLMQVFLEKRKLVHEQFLGEFETKFLAEISLREKINKIARDMEADIVDMMVDRIRVMMTDNKQVISDTNMRKLAHQLYYQTCRSYKFVIAQNIPCQKVWIEKPQYDSSSLNGAAIKRQIKNANRS